MFQTQKGRSFFWIAFNDIKPIFLQMYLDVMIETFEDVIGIDVDIAIYRRYRQHQRFCNLSLSVDINFFHFVYDIEIKNKYWYRWGCCQVVYARYRRCQQQKWSWTCVYYIWLFFFSFLAESRFCLGKYIAKCYSLMYKNRYVHIKTRQF